MDSVRIPVAGGLTLAADVAGPRGGPNVVLLHGGGQTRHSWAGAVAALADAGYRVTNVDARGHGESDWSDTGAYHLDDRADDLRHVVAGLEGPYALVGASLGGGTSIHATAQGLRPRAMILVDVVPNAEVAGVSRIRDFMLAHPSGFESIDEAADAVARYNPDRPRPADPSGLRRNLREREDGRLYWHWDPKIITAPGALRATLAQSAARLADIEGLNVLLVRGLKSDVVSDAGVAAFRAMLPTLEVADVVGASHMVAGDRNDAFLDATKAYLERHMPITAMRTVEQHR